MESRGRRGSNLLGVKWRAGEQRQMESRGRRGCKNLGVNWRAGEQGQMESRSKWVGGPILIYFGPQALILMSLL